MSVNDHTRFIFHTYTLKVLLPLILLYCPTATGEPPLCMSVAVPLAMCRAIQEAEVTPFIQAFSK